MRPATEHRGPRHFCLFFVSKYARCRNDPFRPFPKLHGVVMTHFCRFQNRLGLATLIFAIFKIILASRQPFGPFSKSFGLGDTFWGRFQNRLELMRLIFCPWLKSLLSQINCVRYLPSVLDSPKRQESVSIKQYLHP